ncbi:MAG TPA: anti-sigma factor [Puia sp.]|nr:anti-sigma factor [Puia sp.]
MNVQDYILSGIVESYVLGLSSPEESAEFERMCAAHHEVLNARNAFEILLESRLQEQKVEPPHELKSRIFSEISRQKSTVTPSSPAKPSLVPRTGFAKYVAAASFILLAGSVLLNFYLLSQYKKTIAKNEELIAAQTQIANNNKVLQTKTLNYENAISLMQNPLMTVVKMPGVPKSPAPSSLATIYWNTQSKDVYLLINKLPVPLPNKQYQLWAIVNGKPIDAGIIDMAEGISFVKLKNIPKAEAFAITLEKKGGSSTPDLDAMYVMGKVTG